MTNEHKPVPLSDDDLDRVVGGGLGASGAGATMSPNVAVGDTYAFMELFQKIAQDQRATARESREVAREAQFASIDAASQQMREAANVARASGIASGTANIVSGGISMGGLSLGMAGKSSLGEAALSATKSFAGEAALSGGEKSRLASGQMAEDMGRVTDGLGQTVSAGLSTRAGLETSLREADKSDAAAKTQIATPAEFANNLAQQMQDVRAKMQTVANAKADVMKTITQT